MSPDFLIRKNPERGCISWDLILIPTITPLPAGALQLLMPPTDSRVPDLHLLSEAPQKTVQGREQKAVTATALVGLQHWAVLLGHTCAIILQS